MTNLRLCLLLIISASFSLHAQEEYLPIEPFLNKYCVQCHGPDEQEADIRMDDIKKIDAELWSDIYDQIDIEDMPPRKADQPSDEERTKVNELVLAISRDDRYTISTGFRRLNKREYHNTVTDLLGLSGNVYNPSELIYNDEIDKGFDTNSENLIISNQLLLEYLRSAEKSLRTALFPVSEEPVQQTIALNPSKLGKGAGRHIEKYIERNKATLIIRRKTPISGPNNNQRLISYPGIYRVKATARTVNTKKKQTFGIGRSHDGKSTIIKKLQVGPEYKTIEAEFRMESGSIPQVSFTSGPAKPLVVIRRMKDPSKKIPGIEISQFTIEGPINPEWPPHSYAKIFHMKTMPDLNEPNVREQALRNFVSRAYRRKITPIEIAAYTKYLEKQYATHNNWREAIIRTFAAIMGSHDFLYIKEDIGELSTFQLANRLSYFLWSSMPDIELFKLANNGQLKQKEVYKAQVQRMLKSPKSKEFVQRFASQWLSLDKLGTMRPESATKGFAIYFEEDAEKHMRNETLKYFEHILFQNKPIGDFLDSDYTFLNDTLAKLYKIPFNGDKSLKLVTLPENSTRGGLLGHGSIHALTSNGVETLPVTRGHWVLDELMGIPPPPPPKEVPALVPDTNGANTPRAQLAKHTEIKSCRECHKLMDPAGLALERFDIIGRDRFKYSKKTVINTAGTFMGKDFKDVRGLRKILRENDELFAQNFVIKIAEYAKGRKLNRKDKDIVKKIVESNKETEYKFMDIMTDILTSELMLNR